MNEKTRRIYVLLRLLTPILALMTAGALAGLHVSGWGWFLVVAALAVPSWEIQFGGDETKGEDT